VFQTSSLIWRAAKFACRSIIIRLRDVFGARLAGESVLDTTLRRADVAAPGHDSTDDLPGLFASACRLPPWMAFARESALGRAERALHASVRALCQRDAMPRQFRSEGSVPFLSEIGAITLRTERPNAPNS